MGVRSEAAETAKAVIVYLRERFDLPIAEPTPDEAAAWVERHGFAGDALKRLLIDCSAKRFGLEPTGEEGNPPAYVGQVDQRALVGQVREEDGRNSERIPNIEATSASSRKIGAGTLGWKRYDVAH